MPPDARGCFRRRPSSSASLPVHAAARIARVAALIACTLSAGCFQSLEDSGPKPIVTEGALADVRYEPARRLVSRSCADCHTKNGNNEKKADAWGFAIRLDTYAEWAEGRRVLLERLDTVLAASQDPPVDAMPNAGFRYPLTDAERDTLLQWIRRDSPNTESGF